MISVKKVLSALAERVKVDYIVEESSLDDSTGYIKFASGKAIAYGYKSVTASATTVWASPIYYNDYSSFSNLFDDVKNGLFVATPHVVLTTRDNRWWAIANNVTASGISSLRVITVSSKSSVAFSFDWVAIGRWK